MRAHVLTVSKLTKVFSTPEGQVPAVKDVSFELVGSEFFTMLGPSGCGKTTTLRMLAGLESITSGTVSFDGRDFSRTPASQRNIGMVFQSYALFPHLSVLENAAYGLRVRGVAEHAIKSKVMQTLELLGLKGLSNRYPTDLSGGQQQRVSIARALAYDPTILLLDEPLANLDAKLRLEMREEIRRIQKSLGIMTIYVTHDQEEAMSVSDRLAIFDGGKLVQVGRPQEVYERPESLFVSEFIGRANLFPARVRGIASDTAFACIGDNVDVRVNRATELPQYESGSLIPGFDGVLVARPDQISLGRAGSPGLAGRVQRVQFLGTLVRYVVACPAATREVIVDTRLGLLTAGEGEAVTVTVDERTAVLFHRSKTI